MVVQEDTAVAQVEAEVERVLHSVTLRNAEVLRRLLKFLAEKSLSGEADQLKEYTIGIDALGKPSSYDPRQDSVVRIQIGRLRHKLAEYYRLEGKDDPILLDLPKGHFKLTWQARPVEATVSAAATPLPAEVAQGYVWSRQHITVIAVVCVWALTATIFWLREYRAAAPFRETWTPEVRELWQPFLDSGRPLIVAVAAPLFVGFQGNGFYRDQTLNQWEDVLKSPRVAAIRKAMGDPAIQQRYYYAGSGEVNASLQLGKLLNLSGLTVSTARSSQISWQQMVDNNVLFVGAPRVFGDQLHKLPVAPPLMLKEDGVHEAAGGAALYADNYPSIYVNEANSVPDDGEIHALITRAPGPLGNTDVQTFTSNHSPGVLAAVQWFTNPEFVAKTIGHLRGAEGKIPRYFQVVLKVKYRDAVPTEISWVTHRALGAQK